MRKKKSVFRLLSLPSYVPTIKNGRDNSYLLFSPFLCFMRHNDNEALSQGNKNSIHFIANLKSSNDIQKKKKLRYETSMLRFHSLFSDLHNSSIKWQSSDTVLYVHNSPESDIWFSWIRLVNCNKKKLLLKSMWPAFKTRFLHLKVHSFR